MSERASIMVVLPCLRSEVRTTFTHMATDARRTLGEADLVVTQDGWVVKDRFGPGNRWATGDEMARSREAGA